MVWGDFMQALQIHAAKDLRLAQVEPRSLAANEVRVAIKAGGICGSDLSYYFKGRVGDSDPWSRSCGRNRRDGQ